MKANWPFFAYAIVNIAIGANTGYLAMNFPIFLLDNSTFLPNPKLERLNLIPPMHLFNTPIQ